MCEEEIYSIIEGILFASDESVSVKQIAKVVEMSESTVLNYIKNLIKIYNEDLKRGIKIIKVDNKYQLVTKQSIFKYLNKLKAGLEKPKLTPAMLETLAIIAYKQPATKLEIESIRGIKSYYMINKLMEYELICEVGRAEKIGRPILFGTTDKFLMHFGISQINELPKI